MDKSENKARLDKVYNQLLEIATGNFSYRIERTDKNDEIEALTVLANIIAEEIQDSFFHQGFVNLEKSYACTVQILFILDSSHLIEKINRAVTKVLQFEEYELQNTTFDSLLSKDSKKVWVDVRREMVGPLEQERTVQLSFMTKDGLSYPAYCMIIHFPHWRYLKGKTLVTSIDIFSRRKVQEDRLRKEIRKSLKTQAPGSPNKKGHKYTLYNSDRESIRHAEKYILGHLAEPPPVLADLAHALGTNEFKLKWGFKELYGMTIFQFIKNQRLRKAHVLIRHTNDRIESIARSVGFKHGNHLSREFKKRYGYNPTELRRISVLSQNNLENPKNNPS